MKILMIMDPLKMLAPRWDNTLHLARTLAARGHKCWAADIPDLSFINGNMRASAKPLFYGKGGKTFSEGASQRMLLTAFDLVMIRKEPPVDALYLYVTYMREGLKGKVRVVNDPRGVRNISEKLWTLNFPKRVPPSLVSGSLAEIMAFQKTHGQLVIKRLNDKGGRGVFLLSKSTLPRLKRVLPREGFVLAQKKIVRHAKSSEKRILMLNGKFLSAYEKRPAKNDFRANLDLRATFHRADLNADEKKLLTELRPYLLKEGIHFAGLDVLDGKLIEVNVTCPAGVTESEFLYPGRPLLETWAKSLESAAKV